MERGRERVSERERGREREMFWQACRQSGGGRLS